MPNRPSHHLPHAKLCVIMLAAALALLGPVQPSASPLSAQVQSRHLLLKLDREMWTNPQLALSDLGLSDWERLPVPGWIRITAHPDRVATIAALSDASAVQVVEEDHRLQASITPDDTFWDRQWGPEMVRAPAAWDIQTGGTGAVVAVLDTGIDLTHPDLAGQLWTNNGELPDNGLDDDGNGYVDDIHGWSFIADQGGDALDDDHGHGTHVSGIIAARGNNAQGIAGMAWDSRVMVVKVLDANGDGYYSDLAAGLVYAADNGARVANLSLGGPAPSQILEDAVDYCAAQGTLVVVAAGNTASTVQYPAAYDSALAVAASTYEDQRASYSCYGPEIDLTAPGSSIYSTCVGSSYCYKSGTSMAAPHVAGLAALLYAQSPEWTPDQVAQLLKETAQEMDSPGWDPYTGWGRIDAYRALLKTQPQLHLFFPIIEVSPEHSH
jgi:subtilisin family serine protease